MQRRGAAAVELSHTVVDPTPLAAAQAQRPPHRPHAPVQTLRVAVGVCPACVRGTAVSPATCYIHWRAVTLHLNQFTGPAQTMMSGCSP